MEGNLSSYQLSPSSWNRFEECPRKYWLSRQRLPRKASMPASLGNAIHNSVEEICNLENITWSNSWLGLEYSYLYNNQICPPYPNCLEGSIGYQDTSECLSCEDGYLPDCNGDGDCCPESWIGDGWCDDGELSTACNLICYDEDEDDKNEDDDDGAIMIVMR